jgi:ABC-2 type transport system permease protein
MKRYFQLIAQYIRTALVRHMEFRAQFFGHVLLGCVWIGFMFTVARVFFVQSNDIAGWSATDVYILIATWALIHELFNAFFWSGLSQLTELVTEGTFDTILLRPAHPITQLIFSRFEPAPMVQVAIYVVLLMYFVVQSHIHVTVFGLIVYLLLCVCAILIRLGFFLLLVTLSFWFTNIQNIKFLYYSVAEMGRYPTVVFKSAEIFFLTIVPIAYFGNVQALFFVGRGTSALLAATIVSTVLFLAAAWGLFTWAVRRYSSASS